MEAYPLTWPIGYKRTEQRTWSQFKQSMGKAQQFMHKELNRISATDIIVSSNIPVRKDGMFYTDWMDRKVDDIGVAVYFTHKGKLKVLCCDQYTTIWENVYAIGKTIENIRAIERYGVSDFIERAFTGFTALPESIVTEYKAWYDVLGIKQDAEAYDIASAYRNLAKYEHPDMGGTNDKFIKLNAAYKQGMDYVKSKEE